jgi:hypothetical protein
LPGWEVSSKTREAAAASDALVLGYDVPWPLTLLVQQHHQHQYSLVFSTLLRLRRLQHQLTQQWLPLNARRETSSSTASSAGSKVRQVRQCVPLKPNSETNADASVALQQLRTWHALALHVTSSILGYMLAELSGKLWVEFERAVSSSPVSLPMMLEAHDKLLAAARHICFLPDDSSCCGSNRGDTIGNQGVGSSSDVLAGLIYRLVEEAWELQGQVQLLLTPAAADGGTLEQQLSAQVKQEQQEQAGSPGQQHQGSSRGWQGAALSGKRLEALLVLFKKQLSIGVAALVGHPLAGLAARLGVLGGTL